MKTELMARYVNFYKSLKNSASMAVAFLAKVVCEDIRSTTAMNLNLIGDETGLNPLSANSTQIRNSAKKCPIPEGQTWRISTLEFLLNERKSREDNLERVDQLTAIIDALCSV